MMYTDIYKAFGNLISRPDEYLGAMFINFYKCLPNCYRIYYDENQKLNYVNGINNFHKIRKNIKAKIDSRKLLLNLQAKNNLPIEIFCYSSHDYLVLGTDIPFMLPITLPDETEIANCYEYLFCEHDKVNEIFEFIKGFFEISEHEETVSFGIAAVDVSNSVYTTWYDYLYKDVDIDKNYNDDFKVPYEKICNVVNEDDKTGLILLYGDPGTGKTSVIKNLISKYPDKDFVFIDGQLLLNASQEKLMSYFLENQNTIFILEDCEKALMSRDKGFNPVINTILNITDGIIGDVLGIKLICTFNTSLQNIDKALLRKGRLSVKYEFGKLRKEKVSKILGYNVDKDMTLADIYNVDEENDYSKTQIRKIGF